MGEIDTKPIGSVQTAVSLFDEQGDHLRRNRSSGSQEEKEREIEILIKDLANYKVQLEAKEAAYIQALLKLEHSQKSVDELSTMLRNYEIERERYENECRHARTRMSELESELKEMADQLSETAKCYEQLSLALFDLEATKGELIYMETELDAIKESEIKALTQVEMMESDFNKEKETCEELKKRVSELYDAILVSEKEKHAILSEKDAEIELAKGALFEAEERLDEMKTEMEAIMKLENQLLSKSILVETLQLQLKEANEQISLFAKPASDANSKLLQEELEIKERRSSTQEILIEAFKLEMAELKLELKNANELASHLAADVEMLTGDLQKAKTEIDDSREKEKEAQVEIALLKSELDNRRSKVAAAEAAEVRAESIKSGSYLAVQQLEVEADTAKEENQVLEQADDKENETDDASQVDELNTETKDGIDYRNAHVITTSHNEYESSISRVDDLFLAPVTEDSSHLTSSENMQEVQSLRKELDAAMAKVAEFRNRAEQATCRAEMAEKAKTAIEDQLRKWREERQKKKVLAALGDIPESKEFNTPRADDTPQLPYYQPLYKVLNMKF